MWSSSDKLKFQLSPMFFTSYSLYVIIPIFIAVVFKGCHHLRR
jgi:hypothetical protein